MTSQQEDEEKQRATWQQELTYKQQLAVTQEDKATFQVHALACVCVCTCNVCLCAWGASFCAVAEAAVCTLSKACMRPDKGVKMPGLILSQPLENRN